VNEQLCWVCPECFEIVGKPAISQAAALARWYVHAGGLHATTWYQAHGVDGKQLLVSTQPSEHRPEPAERPSAAKPPMPSVEREGASTPAAPQSEPKLGAAVDEKIETPPAEFDQKADRGQASVIARVLQSSEQQVGKKLLPCRACGVNVREDRMKKHLSERCEKLRPKVSPRTVNAPPPGPAAPSRKILLECRICKEKVRAECMQLHLKNVHPPNNQNIRPQIPTQCLPFELLPPGKWEYPQILDHYRRIAHTLSVDLRGRRLELYRLEAIETLKPCRRWVGKNTWSGYVVFEFSASDRVVLECPIEGNATYILWGDWKSMVGHTKGEIREHFADHYAKVVHKGTWLNRIREALRGSSWYW